MPRPAVTSRQPAQIIVVLALAFTALLGLVGLAIDIGWALAQRQQQIRSDFCRALTSTSNFGRHYEYLTIGSGGTSLALADVTDAALWQTITTAAAASVPPSKEYGDCAELAGGRRQQPARLLSGVRWRRRPHPGRPGGRGRDPADSHRRARGDAVALRNTAGSGHRPMLHGRGPGGDRARRAAPAEQERFWRPVHRVRRRAKHWRGWRMDHRVECPSHIGTSRQILDFSTTPTRIDSEYVGDTLQVHDSQLGQQHADCGAGSNYKGNEDPSDTCD